MISSNNLAVEPEFGFWLTFGGYSNDRASRERMIEDMQLAGLSQGTQDAYVRAVRQLALHYKLSPDRITERQLREYLMHLREERAVALGTFQQHFFGIKFFFVNTLGYEWPLLTKKKFAYPIASDFPTFAATKPAPADPRSARPIDNSHRLRDAKNHTYCNP